MGTVLVIPITIWLVVLSGFVPIVRPPVSAVHDLYALGVARRDIYLTAEQVNEVASTVGVSDEVVRDVVPQVDRLTVWRESVQTATELRQIELQRQAREYAYAVSVGLACDAFLGNIQSQEELVDSVVQQFDDLSQPKLQQILSDTVNLYSTWDEASRESDYNKAAIATFCWYLKNAR
jgi:hypothetical protein